MATFRKRGDRWQARVQRRHAPAAAKTFSTKADAERWARETEAAVERGGQDARAAAQRTTFRDVLSRYEEQFTGIKRGAAQERYRIALFRTAAFAHMPVASIRTTHLTAYRDHRLKSVSPTTVKLELNTLSAIFEACRTEWALDITNPVSGMRRPTPCAPRTRRLEPGEQDQLLDACSRSRTAYLMQLVTLAIETGMRLGELAALRWEHVNLGRRTALLPSTKNGNSRVVPLSSRACETFRRLTPGQQGNVFPVCANSMKPPFRRAANAAGLRDLRFHDLRHEAVSRFFELGLNPIEVAAISGHKTLSMLQRYAHLRATDLAGRLG